MAALVATLLVVPSVLNVLPVAQAIVIGGFDANDGVVDAGAGAMLPDEPSGNTDDSYSGGGPKEDDVCPQADFSHSAPQNADLTGWWVSASAGTPGILYLAWERKAQNGTLTVDFELNQNGTLCTADHDRINPVRTEGDILVTYDFQGGNVVGESDDIAIQVRLWDADQQLWVLQSLAAGSWEASISATEEFGELAINMVVNDILSTDECNDFAAGFAKTRTGARGAFDTSTIKDFIAPTNDIGLSNCGTVNIVKVTNPAGAPEDFSFTASGEFVTNNVVATESFTLDTDPGSVTPTASKQFLAFPGTVSGAETVPAGWALSSLACVNTGTTTAVTDTDADPNEFTVAVNANSDITCTFTNTQQAKILVDKVTVPASDPQSFDFTLSGPSGFTTQNFSLTHVAAPHDSGFVAPGSGYSISETVPSNWDQTSATCNDGNSTVGNVNLSPGETVTCTFTNTKRGAIVVDKETTPAASPQSFAFSLTGGPSSLNQSFNLTDQATPHNSGPVLPGNGYAASETVPSGWVQSTASCSNGTTANIVVAPGQTTTCTFSNTQLGRIVIDKVTTPSGDPQQFAFTLTGGPSNLNQSFSLADATTPHSSGFVTPGSGYSAAETVPSGWDLTSATCNDGNSTVTDINVSPGEVVTCTFNNTKRGGIVVDKVTTPSGDPQSFNFSLTGPNSVNQSFSLTDAATPRSSGPLVPGSGYSVAETVPSGWDLTSATCSDGSAPASITLDAGETVTCTFNNTKRATLTIVKDSVPNGPRDFAFTTTGSGLSPFSLDDDSDSTLSNTKPFTNLVPGDYSVTETAVVGWAVTSIDCGAAAVTIGASGGFDAGDRSVGVTLDPGENVTCTFQNTDLLPTITVTKTVDPTRLNEPGGSATFSVVVANTSPEPVSLFELTDSIYGNIADAANPAISSTTCALPQTLAVGGSYTCAFTAVVAGNAGDSETDVVTAKASDADGNVATADDDAIIVLDDILPVIAVEKAASAALVRPGTVVTYTYVVTNPGIEPLLDVTVTDDKCSPVTYVSGDTDGDDSLDSNEQWTFSCSAPISVDTVNTVTATGHDDDGNTVSATDTASVSVVNAVINIDKTAEPTGGAPGTPITYTYVVTVPKEPLTNVRVSDDQCAPVTYVTGDDGDNVLEPGEQWRYTCTRAADGSAPTNTATAIGTDRTGATVQASDTVTIAVVEPVVLQRIPELPRTGSNSADLAKLAASLMLLGLSLLFVARSPSRRRGTAA